MPFAGRRILGLFAHPDDESYAAGGTLALCARGGAEVTVATATCGEGGTYLQSPQDPSESIGEARGREQKEACRALGVGALRWLGLPDGRLEQALPDLVDRVTQLLRAQRPHVVITLGPDGAYGHRDHIACTRAVDRACEGLPHAQQPRVLHAVFPKGLFLSVYRTLRRAPASPISPEVTSAELGVDVSVADLRVSIAPVREAKLAAIAAHSSQLVDGDPRSFLREGLLDALLEHEWFVRSSGPDLPPGATDPFTGL